MPTPETRMQSKPENMQETIILENNRRRSVLILNCIREMRFNSESVLENFKELYNAVLIQND